MSPETQTRENRKIDLLLEINRFLFQEIVQLQAVGRGGQAQSKGSEPQAQGAQQSPTTTDGGKDGAADAKENTNPNGEAKSDEKEKEKKPINSREYIEYVLTLPPPTHLYPCDASYFPAPSTSFDYLYKCYLDACDAFKPTSPTSPTSCHVRRSRKRR